MRYETNTEELKVASKALKFANSDPKRSRDVRAWSTRQYRQLGVLPPRTAYFVDDLGRIFPRNKNQIMNREDVLKRAAPDTTKKYWNILRGVLDRICDDPMMMPDVVIHRIRKPIRRGSVVTIEFPKEVWLRCMLDGIHVQQTDQAPVFATIDTFVKYASMVLSKKHWRGRLSKCQQCHRYFLNPIRRGGRRRKVCGEQCAKRRGDPTRIERQRKYRKRRKRNVK